MEANVLGYYIHVEPDVRIYTEDVNPKGKRTILFIHGWPANHNLFEYQFNDLPGYDCRCIGVDLRGFGKSDKPWRKYSLNRLADDIYCVIKSLQLQDIMLVGHSVGGAVAIRYMSRHCGYQVSKLALLGAAAPSVVQRPNFPHGLPIEEVNRLIEGTYEDRPKMLEQFGTSFFHQKISQPFAEWFLQMGLEAAGWATAKVAKTFRDETLFSDLCEIHVPTLILHGIHDQVCLYPLATALHKGIPHSKLVPFEHSGHGLMWEEKEKLNKELIKFINGTKKTTHEMDCF
ncbi:non-heme chloroperoxidase [Baia soyae]|uniref:Non-heme chloroperoxidase n=1 Tax=Baia soyae TaxID=1544746 RepID=A0A4R2SFW6_9BACL|nr:non-heme chloroperoxidase [Baia soyae]